MATKKNDENQQIVKAVAFTKEQLTSAKRYRHVKDIVNVLLKNDRTYTIEEVDDLITKFKKEKVN